MLRLQSEPSAQPGLGPVALIPSPLATPLPSLFLKGSDFTFLGNSLGHMSQWGELGQGGAVCQPRSRWPAAKAGSTLDLRQVWLDHSSPLMPFMTLGCPLYF